MFGDKRGLLDALAERGLERYAAQKAALAVTGDPVADLHAGWADHMAFAAGHPALYRLMFAPRPWASGSARDGVLELLRQALRRAAAAGVLRLDVDTAAAVILSANVGLALNRIARSDVFGDPALSDAMRDVVFRSVLVDAPPAPEASPLAAAATRLDAQLGLDPAAAALRPEESALLRVWLARLAADA